MAVFKCDLCEATFTRHQNMIRHKANLHAESEENNEEITSDVVEDDEDSNDEEITSDVVEDDEDSSDGDSIDEESNDGDADDEGSDSEKDEDEDGNAEQYNVWAYLRRKAFTDSKVSAKYEKTLQELVEGGASENTARRDALRVVSPIMREIVNKTYTDMLMLWHFAEEDDSHEKIMATKRKLMDDEDYDAGEAIRYAVKKRRFLIQKKTRTLDEDFKREPDTEDEDDSDQDSPDQDSPAPFKGYFENLHHKAADRMANASLANAPQYG